jgi:hypothetical protein
LGEYRQRSLVYKYAKYQQQDEERMQKRLREKQEEENKDDPDNVAETDRTNQGADKWEENKESEEILAIFNFKKASSHFLKATVTVNDAQRQLLDNA